MRCGVCFTSLSLLVVAPQVGRVDLGRAGVARQGDERSGQAVFEVAGYGEDRAVVVSGLAGGVLGPRDGLLGVVDRVVGVLVSRLVDGRVQSLGADQVAL